MKYLFFFTASLFIAAVSQGQTSQDGRKISYTSIDTLTLMDSAGITTEFPYNISIKALQDFGQYHKTAGQVAWQTIPGGFVVSFLEDRKNNRIVYNKKGNWLYQMASYPASLLDPYIREEVLDAYHSGYSIYWVNEFHGQFKSCYIIRLEGKTNWIQVKIIDGEMFQMDEILK